MTISKRYFLIIKHEKVTALSQKTNEITSLRQISGEIKIWLPNKLHKFCKTIKIELKNIL